MRQGHHLPGRPALRLTAIAMALTLTACAAGETAISKRNLAVQSQMTDTIFLEPVAPGERTIFVEVKNTSDKPDLDIAPAIRAHIEARGYRIVDDPAEARFMLQANVLQAGRNTETAAQHAYDGGTGSLIIGGAAGAGVGYGLGKAGGNDALLVAGGALVGAAAAVAADAFIQDVTYTIISDIRVSERGPAGVVISQSETGNLDQGSSGGVFQSSATTSEWKRYETRIVSKANKVNLEWEEAAPDLTAGLARSVAGIF